MIEKQSRIIGFSNLTGLLLLLIYNVSMMVQKFAFALTLSLCLKFHIPGEVNRIPEYYDEDNEVQSVQRRHRGNSCRMLPLL